MTSMGINVVEHIVGWKFSKIYTIIFGKARIETLVTRNPHLVKSWVRNIECVHSSRRDHLIVGLDAEWHPNFDRGNENPVATLQLCVENECLIFQILHAPTIPKALQDFLADQDYTFVGVGIKNDIKKLFDDYCLEISNIRDLRSWAAQELDKKKLRKVGLKDLAKEVLGMELEKPREVTLSNWCSAVLTKLQVCYACLDAYVSFEIGRRLSSRY